MNQKGFIPIVLVIIGLIVLMGTVGYFVIYQPLSPSQSNSSLTPTSTATSTPNPEPTPTPIPIPTPTPTPKGEQVSLQEGQRDGSLLVQKIYPDHITGLNYREYPLATDQGDAVTLYVGDSASNGCTITLTLISINGNVATFTKKTDFNRPCPICLVENTLIDTPAGAIAVQDLRVGMNVWTTTAAGDRIATKIIKNVQTPVPADHQVIHLTLDDGRELFASPGHPTSDGRTIGNLIGGDMIDGGQVVSTGSILYGKNFTYDILPEGETGSYWANGILVGSTLFNK